MSENSAQSAEASSWMVRLTQSTAYGWVLGIGATVAFSVATPLARGVLVGGADPTMLLLVRLSLAVLLYGLTIAFTKPSLLRPGGRAVGMALLAGTLNGVGQLLYFWALLRLDSSIAAMLLSTSPVMVLTLLVLRGERFTYRHLIRIGLALVGVYLLIGPAGDVDLIGVGLILLALVTFAIQLAMAQWVLMAYDALSVTFYVTVAMLMVTVGWWLWDGPVWHSLTPGAWIAAIVLAVVSTYLARLFMYRAVAFIGSAQMSLLTPLEVLLAVTWSILFLNERLTLLHWIGGAFIMASVLLAIKRLNRTPRRPRWRTWARP